jgi:hypothetical protein
MQNGRLIVSLAAKSIVVIHVDRLCCPSRFRFVPVLTKEWPLDHWTARTISPQQAIVPCSARSKFAHNHMQIDFKTLANNFDFSPDVPRLAIYSARPSR